MNYALLCNPGHNRVYFKSSQYMALAELTVASQKLSAIMRYAKCKTIAKVNYINFETDTDLSYDDVAIISSLSFCYAIFKIEEIRGIIHLEPLAKTSMPFINESISSMLKYTGKTNELFTRMLINVALYSQDTREDIRLLDPVAGKGTTLFEGLVRGFDVYGIEIGSKVVNETHHFLKKFLETERYKFSYGSSRISDSSKSFSALKHSYETAENKDNFKNRNTKKIELVAGDSVYADKYFKKSFFNIIVGDLPYGVQHGNVTNEKQTSRTRNPIELLNACLPAWTYVLKPGGVIALSWNTNVVNCDTIVQVLEEHGLVVLNSDPYLLFRHRVDQSIVRDIVVARKPIYQ